jgi:hypothetical protein
LIREGRDKIQNQREERSVLHVARIKAFTAEPFHQKLSVFTFPTARVDGTSGKQGRCTPTNERCQVTNRPGSADNHSTPFSVVKDLLLPAWLTSIVDWNQVDQGWWGLAEASFAKETNLYRI